MTKSATKTNVVVYHLKPEDLLDSPLQPRTTYSQAEISQMASTMKPPGRVHQNLIARQAGVNNTELVFGHKRKRAAIEAGLETVPVEIRVMTDREVRIAQIVENSERSDVHPLQECEAYVALREEGLTAEEIAALLGLPNAQKVYRRLTLATLCAKGRTACLKGELGVGVAELVARIPDKKLQEKAVEHFSVNNAWDGGWTLAEARRELRETYMLRLATASFDIADDKLVKKAGSCVDCPKRTGSCKELFPVVEDEDTCTDPPCFEKKTAAHQKVLIKTAKKNGSEVIEDEALIKKLFPWGDALKDGHGYYDLDGQATYKDGLAVSWREVLGADTPTTVILVVTPKGTTKHLVTKPVLTEAAKKLGLTLQGKPKAKPKKPRSKMTPGELKAADKAKADKVKAKRQDAIVKASRAGATAAVVTAFSALKVDKAMWLFLLSRFIGSVWHDTVKMVCARRGLTAEVKDRTDYVSAILTHADTLNQKDIRGLFLELCLRDTYGSLFSTTVKHLGVDLKAMEKKVTAEYDAAILAKQPEGTGLVHVRDKQATEAAKPGVFKTVCKTRAKVFTHRTQKTAKKDPTKLTCPLCRKFIETGEITTVQRPTARKTKVKGKKKTAKKKAGKKTKTKRRKPKVVPVHMERSADGNSVCGKVGADSQRVEKKDVTCKSCLRMADAELKARDNATAAK